GEQLRHAADAIPGDPKTQAELRDLATRIERELPDSNAPRDLIAFALRLVFRRLADLVVTDDVRHWADNFRDQSYAQLQGWERSFSSQDELKQKGRDLWQRLRGE